MLSEIDEKIRKNIKKIYNKNKKHINLAVRVAVMMSITIAIGVNCLYIEDYILLVVYAIGIGIILFFVPIEKIKSFLGLDN